MNNTNKSFQCYKCGLCCKNLFQNSIVIFPSDAERICRVIGISKKEFLVNYCVDKNIQYGNKSVKVFFIKVDKSRQCAFLRNNLCTIYPDRPIQCQRTPYDFFSYIELWKYMPCIIKNEYPEGQSYFGDRELVNELLKGY